MKLINRFVNLAWTLIAALVIATAAFISIVRVMLPEIDQQRPAIEDWLTALVGRPATIGEISATWYGWTPNISVTELTLREQTGNRELVSFDSASIGISIIDSILERNLVPDSLVVSGVRLTLTRKPDGTIAIAGMPPSKWPVAEWLLQQQNLAVKRADITFIDELRNTPVQEYSNVAVSIRRNGDVRVIHGRFRGVDRSNPEARFLMRAEGDLLGSDWSGRLLVDLRNIAAESLADYLGLQNFGVATGTVTAKVWTTWREAQLQSADIEIAADEIRFVGDTSSTLEHFAAAGTADRIEGGWSLTLGDVRFGNEYAAGGQTSLRLLLRRDEESRRLIHFDAGNVPLADVTPLALRVAKRLTDKTDMFSDMKPSGLIERLSGAVRINPSGAPDYVVDTVVRGLSLTETRATPGLRGLDVRLNANRGGGVLNFDDAQTFSVTSEARLVSPLEVQHLDGYLAWEHTAEGTWVKTDRLRTKVETIDFAARGEVLLPAAGKPRLAVVIGVESGDLSRLNHLIPKNIFPAKGELWVRHIFPSGALANGRAVLRGSLADFPFDDNSGTLQVEFDIAAATAKYSLNWPQIDAVEASFRFDNRQVSVDVHAGHIYSADIAGSRISLPDLFTAKRVVHVSGRAPLKPDDATRIIMESPLRNSKAKRVAQLEISGEIAVTLDLNLQLYPDGEKEVLGQVHFDGNRVNAAKEKITIDDLHGDVSFTRHDWYGEGLTGIYDGIRVGLVLNGGLEDPNYDSEFRMTGVSDIDHLLKNIEKYSPLLHGWLARGEHLDDVTGEVSWKAVMTIPEPEADASVAPKRLTIQSSLIGLELNLPWPLGKSASESRPLTITTLYTSSGERTIGVDLGEFLDTEVAYTTRSDGSLRVERAEIMFGRQRPVFKRERGIVVSGEVADLPLHEWITFLQGLSSTDAREGEELTVYFDVNIASLGMLGRRFKEVELAGGNSLGHWDVNVSSEALQGTLMVPKLFRTEQWRLDFNKLWLSEDAQDKERRSVDPTKIPPFELTAKSFRYGDIDLGRATVKTKSVATGLHLESFSFVNESHAISGSGEWLETAVGHKSHFDISIKGGSLGGLLNNFGYDVASIDGGETTIEIDASWDGMPSDFTLERLEGNLILHVAQGRFLDIEPGGGRVFGLLSIQTLPRRLSLDFDDLFKKGFSFDSIEGSFQLDRGNAYTNSLLMNGPAARIDVSGRTGLAEQDYDQHVTVTPALSSSIPLASAFFGPAGIGVGAVIYLGQKMFKSIPNQLDKFLSREYSITGSWDQPIIERI